MAELPLLLTVEQAAELAQISRSHAYALLNAGAWPSIQLGRSRRIPRGWLERWITAQVEAWESARSQAGGAAIGE